MTGIWWSVLNVATPALNACCLLSAGKGEETRPPFPAVPDVPLPAVFPELLEVIPVRSENTKKQIRDHRGCLDLARPAADDQLIPGHSYHNDLYRQF